MKSKALFFGVALGVLAAIAPACGGTQMCSAANCRGCCQNNMCVTTNTADATCGINGVACDNCTTKGQTCNATSFSCIAVAGTGGATGTGGAVGMGGMTGSGGAVGMGGSSGIGGMPAGASCNPQNRMCGTGQTCVATDDMLQNGVCTSSCDIFSNSGCTPGNACQISQAQPIAFQCFPQSGTAAVGAACSLQAAASCVTGAQCLGTGAMATTGTCVKFCSTSSDCPSNFRCGVIIPFGSSFVGSCVAACDVLAQNCAANEACVLGGSGPVCFLAGNKNVGDACATANECSRGLGCIGAQNAATCRRLCSLDGGSPNCQGASGSCQPLLAGPDAGFAPFGFCNQ
jgi:hypothetical protein